MGMSSPGSDTHEQLPPVDEHIVAPGSRFECDDGMLVEVPPADPPHAISHANLAWLLRAHVAPELNVAVDMLTRTSRRDDIAPDASIFPREPDPETGGRQLEHIAFEIASTQRLARVESKAVRLIGRGVRRVFAIDLIHTRVLEWSRELGTWMILDSGASIEDPTLAVPLPIAALLQAIDTDEAVARALLGRAHPILESAINAGRLEGRLEGQIGALVTALLAVLGARGLAITPSDRDRIQAMRDAEQLQRWIARAAVCDSVDALLSS